MTPAWLTDLATWAAQTSLAAMPLAVVLAALSLWRGLPVAWRWMLPALFFLRLALPEVPAVSWNPVPSAEAAILSEPTAAPASEAVASPPEILIAIWALGVAVVALWVGYSHLRLQSRIAAWSRPASPEVEAHALWATARLGLARRVPIREVSGLSTLAVHGWWRPLLLAPDDLATRFEPRQIRGMLLHELTHVRRRDVLWTWFALGLCALHWFNPLAWLALRRLHAERELACDAAALQALEPIHRPAYGEALLRCLTSRPLAGAPALAPFFRHLPELKQRLQNIMTPQNPNIWTRFATVLLVPSIAAFTFTIAKAEPPREGDATKPVSPESPATREGKPGDVPAAESRTRSKESDRNRDGAASREGEQRSPREGAREGERPRRSERDGEMKPEGSRDGERPRAGERGGERKREGARESERAGNPERDGERKRDAERKRDGERPAERRGPRDGEAPRKGPRDGEVRREGARDAEARKEAPREDDARKADGEKAAER